MPAPGIFRPLSNLHQNNTPAAAHTHHRPGFSAFCSLLSFLPRVGHQRLAGSPFRSRIREALKGTWLCRPGVSAWLSTYPLVLSLAGNCPKGLSDPSLGQGPSPHTCRPGESPFSIRLPEWGHVTFTFKPHHPGGPWPTRAANKSLLNNLTVMHCLCRLPFQTPLLLHYLILTHSF